MLARYDGGELVIEGFDGKLCQLRSVRALAPGQPLSVQVVLDAPCTLQLKSLGSVRLDDGAFRVRARVVTLPRATREALLARLSAASMGEAFRTRPRS